MYLICFQHVRPQILASFPHPNLLKNTPQNWHWKVITSNQDKTSKLINNDTQQDPQIQWTSLKIQPWSPRCPLWCSCRPLNHQLVIHDQKANPRGTQIDPQSLPKWSIAASYLFSKSSKSVVNLFNKSSISQVNLTSYRGASGRGESSRKIPCNSIVRKRCPLQTWLKLNEFHWSPKGYLFTNKCVSNDI